MSSFEAISGVHFGGELNVCLFKIFLRLFCFGLAFVGSIYLDHAGATLYSELQMEAIFKDLSTNVYGNPRILFSQSIVVVYDVEIL